MIARASLAWSAVGLLAAVALPWYALQEGLDSGAWLSGLWSAEDYASGLAQIVEHGKWWLAPVPLALAACLVISLVSIGRERRGFLLMLASVTGLVLFVAQALGIGLRGWNAAWLDALFGELDGRQVGLGAGGAVTLIALLCLLSIGLALSGAFGGDEQAAGIHLRPLPAHGLGSPPTSASQRAISRLRSDDLPYLAWS